ncbi:MAG: DUF2254 domain-containing protein [Nitrospira sp.]|nr:DUF2254 domain-containing protein [Nitrospira sp. BO4]
MSVRIRRRILWDHLRSALWVMPTVSVVIFLVAGAVLSHVSIGDNSPLRLLVFQGTPEDARQMLIVVSSTMITVTGLVFALTIIALQIASGQYSPRLLRNFMRDRGTQFVLSVFVGAFAYSTAGLHTVGVQNPDEAAFMPRLAVSGSLGLALASLGVLIYFIHHLSSSIQIDTIMSMIVRETLQVIDDLCPDQIGSPESEERCPDPPAWAIPLPSHCSGYIQEVSPQALVHTATEKDLIIRLVKSVGHHVIAGTPIAWAWHPSADHPSPDPELEKAIRDSVQIGFERTMLQDVPFGIRRLVDIGNRALSSAINDPYTATQAVHHLSEVLCVLARRRLGDRLYRDEQGTVRVAIPFPGFADYLQLSTGQIRRFGAKEPTVVRSLIQLLKNVCTSTASQDRRAAAARHIRLALEGAKREIAQAADAESLLAYGDEVLRALAAGHPESARSSIHDSIL